MGTPADDIRFEVTDRRSWTDERVAEATDLANLLQAEILPDDAPLALERALAAGRTLPARHHATVVTAHRPDGALVGRSDLFFDPANDPNPDILWGSAAVHPDDRRRHVASRLVAHQIGVARALGRGNRFVFSTTDLRPETAAWAASLGAEPKQAWHVNTLHTAEVDRALLERWVAEAAERAPGYELLRIDGPVPDDLAEAFVALTDVMNTMPHDDLEVNDRRSSVAELREGEARREAAGAFRWQLVARRASDGALAGFTQVGGHPSDPKVLWVASTGVEPSHRGHHLGHWMKAVMTLRILAELPEVTEIRTGNADSNGPMLAINTAMGYRAAWAETSWEVPTDAVVAWLSERGIEVPDLASTVAGLGGAD